MHYTTIKIFNIIWVNCETCGLTLKLVRETLQKYK